MQKNTQSPEHAERSTELKGYYGRVSLMLDTIAAAHIREGKTEAEAHRLAEIGVIAVTDALGGQQFYLPFGSAFRRELRNLQIWREFNGTNTNQLAKKYRLSYRHILEILAKIRKQNRIQS